MTTRDKLLDAAGEMLATEGLTGLSARTVAARAGVNQALVFYHFGSVAELVESALRRSADLAVATYRNRFDDVTSFTDLLTLGCVSALLLAASVAAVVVPSRRAARVNPSEALAAE